MGLVLQVLVPSNLGMFFQNHNGPIPFLFF